MRAKLNGQLTLQTATVWLVGVALSGPVTVLDGKGDEKGRGDMKLTGDQTFDSDRASGGSMIDYEAGNWQTIVWRFRGTVLPKLFWRVLVAAAVGVLASFLWDSHRVKIPSVLHTLIGVALGLLLVFRTNASYDRYWEGRKLLGAMVNRTSRPRASGRDRAWEESRRRPVRPESS